MRVGQRARPRSANDHGRSSLGCGCPDLRRNPARTALGRNRRFVTRGRADSSIAARNIGADETLEDALIRWLQTTALLRADVAAVIGTVLAIGVTGHALLRKRRVSVAVGWIGLAWLSPVFGTALYLLFGINRVERRARKFVSKPSAAPGTPNTEDAVVPEVMWPLDRAVRRITGLPALAGNAIRLFRNGDAAYPAMLAAIGEARTSIALSSYIFRDDPTGRTFCAALEGGAGAGRRGSRDHRRHRRRLLQPRGLSAPEGRRHPGRAVHAFRPALADALPEPAHAQEASDPRRARGLHRGPEHLAAEPLADAARPSDPRHAFPRRRPRGRTPDAGVLRRLGLRRRGCAGGTGLVSRSRTRRADDRPRRRLRPGCRCGEDRVRDPPCAGLRAQLGAHRHALLPAGRGGDERPDPRRPARDRHRHRHPPGQRPPLHRLGDPCARRRR